MPMPAGGPYEPTPYGFKRLTPEEQAVLRRLMGRERPLRYARRTSARRERAAVRQRRRVLEKLAGRDLRSLVQIVMELGL